MPYIKQSDRDSLNDVTDNALDRIATDLGSCSHLLGYIAARLVSRFLESRYEREPNPCLLSFMNSVIHKLSYRQCSPDVEFMKQNLTVLLDNLLDNVGEYNYCITYLFHQFLIINGVSYELVNRLVGILDRVKSEIVNEMIQLRAQPEELVLFDDALGILRCVQLELYRIIAVPYENLKLKKNGSVSILDAVHKKEIDKYGRPRPVGLGEVKNG